MKEVSVSCSDRHRHCIQHQAIGTMDKADRNIPGVAKHVDMLEIFLAKQKELEKHTTDHARNMSKTLEDIENAEQEIKIVRKKISDNKGETSCPYYNVKLS